MAIDVIDLGPNTKVDTSGVIHGQTTLNDVLTTLLDNGWKRALQVDQAAGTSIDQTIDVTIPSSAKEIMYTLQNSNGRTFASSIIPLAQFIGGAIYAMGSYALYSGSISSNQNYMVNAVAIYSAENRIEIAASSSPDGIRHRVYYR